MNHLNRDSDFIAIRYAFYHVSETENSADGLSVREIGSELGKSESSIESLMTRARDAFRRSYGEPTDV